MYLRTTKRKNKNGTTVQYYQLAHNERHPETKKTFARVIHNFGRADTLDTEDLVRLCKSIARICRLEVTDSVGEFAKAENRYGSVSECRGDRRTPDDLSHDSEVIGKQDPYIRQLEKAVAHLQESEEKYKTIFHNANDEIVYLDTDGTIIEVNDKVEDIFGYKREEVIGKNFVELGVRSPENLQIDIERLKGSVDDNPLRMEEIYAYHKNGTEICMEVNASIVREKDEVKGVLAIIRDITERKRTEEALEKYREHLEELVNERTNNLEEVNIALKVLLKKREKDKDDLGEKILANVKELVLPFLEKLKSDDLNKKQKAFVEIMEYNLNDIISPFVREFSSRFLNLTATEIRISNLVKQGKTTKEVAALLSMSPRTVDIHRYNIRKKLGINNKKAGLTSHLLSYK